MLEVGGSWGMLNETATGIVYNCSMHEDIGMKERLLHVAYQALTRIQQSPEGSCSQTSVLDASMALANLLGNKEVGSGVELKPNVLQRIVKLFNDTLAQEEGEDDGEAAGVKGYQADEINDECYSTFEVLLALFNRKRKRALASLSKS
jgi:hypothetical protein